MISSAFLAMFNFQACVYFVDMNKAMFFSIFRTCEDSYNNMVLFMGVRNLKGKDKIDVHPQ